MALEGYSSTLSLLPGDQIDFHLNADAPTDVTVRILRVSKASPVVATGSGHVVPQTARANASAAGAGWAPAYTLDVPANWATGIYHAEFTAGAHQTRVAFVVRPAEAGSTSSALLATCATTAQAYNSWGGSSLYPSPGSPGAENRSRRVSFDRPYVIDPTAGDPSVNVLYTQEEKFILWMDDQGLAVEVCTGVDLHSGRIALDRYSLFISVGHDEYWSREMRDAVEAFIASGGNAAFFSGNTCWWQVRFENGDRTMVCYKSALEDPLTGVDNSRVTVNWYDAPVARPENAMTGVSFRNGAGRWTGGVDGAYTATFAQHWVFEGTGLQNGQVFANGCVGYEADAAQLGLVDAVPVATGRDGTPVDFQVLATADLSGWDQFGQPGKATMGVYQRQGTVFTAATTDWAYGLQDKVVSRITQNVVSRLSRLGPPDLWEQVGHAADVVAMCSLYWWADMGPSSGRYFFAATRDNRLWRRAPDPVNVTWEPIGDAVSVLSMAGVDARLYAITADGRLWQRTALPGEHWDPLGDAPADAAALAAAEGRLFVVTGAGALLQSAPIAPLAWQQLGTPGPVVAMTAQGGVLAGVSGDGRLLSLAPARPDSWQSIGRAPGMLALAAMDGRLFAADGAGRFWARPAGGVGGA